MPVKSEIDIKFSFLFVLTRFYSRFMLMSLTATLVRNEKENNNSQL